MQEDAMPAYHFYRKVCSKCQLDCSDTSFCVHMQHTLGKDFESIFDHINRNFLKITSSNIGEALIIICDGCPLKQECFVEQYDYECTHKLRKQLGPSCEVSDDDFIYGFGHCCSGGSSYVNTNRHNNYNKPAVFITDDTMEKMFR